jgi:Na+-translocating ferredoxin:NAD+ oxidoreductase subunit G
MMDLATLRENLHYQGLSLGAVALITSALLALAAAATGPAIQAAEARDLMASLAQVLPGGFDNDLLGDTVTVPGPDGEVTVYRARHGAELEGVIFKVKGQGYAGPIVALLGLTPDGRVLGVRVLKHAETPGLGDKIEPTKGDWIHRFAGKALGTPPAERWAVKKDGGDFDQFSGATITPRALVRAIKGGLELFARERERMLGGSAERVLAAAKP